MTIVVDLLCKAQPHGAVFGSAGLWCVLSLPLQCVTYEGGWALLQHGLKLFTGL